MRDRIDSEKGQKSTNRAALGGVGDALRHALEGGDQGLGSGGIDLHVDLSVLAHVAWRRSRGRDLMDLWIYGSGGFVTIGTDQQGEKDITWK